MSVLCLAALWTRLRGALEKHWLPIAIAAVALLAVQMHGRAQYQAGAAACEAGSAIAAANQQAQNSRTAADARVTAGNQERSRIDARECVQ